MGMLEEYKARMQGVCATCDHVVQLNYSMLIGCEVRDKFILPNYPPYSGTHKCPNWLLRRSNDAKNH